MTEKNANPAITFLIKLNFRPFSAYLFAALCLLGAAMCYPPTQSPLRVTLWK